MNFQDLLAKMKHIDEGEVLPDLPNGPATPVEPKDQMSGGAGASDECSMSKPEDVLLGEKPVEECGLPGMDSMPSGMMGMGAPKQADNVSMNVSLNGQGAGGVRNLMDILKNIESQHSQHGSDDTLLGAPEEVIVADESVDDGGFGDSTTSPEQEFRGVNAVTGTGDDLASKGGERPKVNGGGNPLEETLMARLTAHYQSIKERQ